MDLEQRVSTLEISFAKHEGSCAERQGSIMSRLNRIESIMLAVLAALVLGLFWLVFNRHGF